MMRLDREFREFVACSIDHDVRSMVVGDYAVAAHGHPRYTGDIDIWLQQSADNAERVLAASADFGFGSVGLTTGDFTRPNHVVQLGCPPLRIDLLTSVDGVEFEACDTDRLEIVIDGVAVCFHRARRAAAQQGRKRSSARYR